MSRQQGVSKQNAYEYITCKKRLSARNLEILKKLMEKEDVGDEKSHNRIVY